MTQPPQQPQQPQQPQGNPSGSGPGQDAEMPGAEPVANRVIRRVVTRAIGDAAYRRTLLEDSNAVMADEFARAGIPVPDTKFDAVEATENRWVLRVPFATSERSSHEAFQPLFEFVDSAGKDDLDRFVRAPRSKLEELLGIEIEEGVDVVVRIESEGQRVLVVPRDEFGPISSDSDLPASEEKIKLCPAGCTFSNACPQGNTFKCGGGTLCPQGCTFNTNCGCTISCTVTPDFPTIDQSNLLDESQDSVQKLSDRLDD